MKITVAGTGYVGLVNGVCLAEMGYDVVCIDRDETKVNALPKGIPAIYEPGLEGLLKKNNKAGRLPFTMHPQEAYPHANLFFIAVGTPDFTIAEQLENDCSRRTVPVGNYAKIEEIILRLKPPPV
jgi:UDPglucose 6-dehydrogenase